MAGYDVKTHRDLAWRLGARPMRYWIKKYGTVPKGVLVLDGDWIWWLG